MEIKEVKDPVRFNAWFSKDFSFASKAFRNVIKNLNEDEVKNLKDCILSNNAFSKNVIKNYSDIDCFVDCIKLDDGSYMDKNPSYKKYNSKQRGIFRNKIKKFLRNFDILIGVINVAERLDNNSDYNILKDHFNKLYLSKRPHALFKKIKAFNEDQWKNFADSFAKKYFFETRDPNGYFRMILRDFQSSRLEKPLEGFNFKKYADRLYVDKLDYLYSDPDFLKMLGESPVKGRIAHENVLTSIAASSPQTVAKPSEASSKVSDAGNLAPLSSNSEASKLANNSNFAALNQDERKRLTDVVDALLSFKVENNSIDRESIKENVGLISQDKKHPFSEIIRENNSGDSSPSKRSRS